MCYHVSDHEDDAIAVLKHSDRVRYVELHVTRPQWWKVVASMQGPFPALTRLQLSGCADALLLPIGFLGGSAPCLQQIVLHGIPFPKLPSLLLSARDLVSLQIDFIPRTGYIPPKVMVASLALLTRLEDLSIGFFRPQMYLPNLRITYPETPRRAILPALTRFLFAGRSEYLDNLVAEVDAPRLYNVRVEVIRLDFRPVPQLFLFISHTENLKFRRVHVDFSCHEVLLKTPDLSISTG